MPLVFCADFWDVSEGIIRSIRSVAYHLGYRVPVNCAKCVGRRRHSGAVDAFGGAKAALRSGYSIDPVYLLALLLQELWPP